MAKSGRNQAGNGLHKVACLYAGLLVSCSLLTSVAAATSPALPASNPPPITERWSKFADTVFQNLSTDQGLPNALVTALAEDSDGFLWVGTQGGLARWDGYRFHTYRSDEQVKTALPANYVRILHTDVKGRLWVGTVNGGLALYDREHDSFKLIPVGAAGTNNVSIKSITDDNSDGVWVGSEGGLHQINPDTGVVRNLRHSATDAGSLPDNRVQALLMERNGTMWVGTRGGLSRRAGNATGDGGFITVPLPDPAGQVLTVISLAQGRDGRIWIGTTQQGAFVLDPVTGVVKALAETSEGGSIQSEWISTIVETNSGEMWLGTVGQGILAVDTKTMQTRRIRNDPSLPTSLAHNSAWAMLRDRSGLLWVGNERGLSIHDPQQTAILTVFGASSRQGALTDVDVMAVLPAPDGRIWLGTHHNGIDILDPVTGKVVNLRAAPSEPGGTGTKTVLPKVPVLALAADADGDIYIGTYGGLYRTDRDALTLSLVSWPSRNAAEPIGALLSDDKRIWVGGNDGLWSIEPAAGINKQPVSAPGAQLSDKRITALAHGAGGTVWIGTQRGLNLYDPRTQQIERILSDGKDPEALSSSLITSILTDRQNRLWIGTNGGVNLLIGRDAKGKPRFRHFGAKEGISNVNVDKLLEDATGNIWVGTDGGVSIIDSKNFTVRALGRSDGIAIAAYWSNSGAAFSDGELLFGGTGGLVVVRPERYKDWSYRPPIVITDIRIQGKPVPSSLFNRSALQPATLTIQPDANSFAVEFAALDYSAPERNRYAYRLDGYDTAWIDTDSTRRLAAYTNLPPGDYRLRLRGSNRNGVWTEQEMILPIHVAPAWYQTWWMRCLELMAGLGVIYLLDQIRTRYLRKRQRELENQVSQRTDELREKHRELEQNQMKLQEKQVELVLANNELNAANSELAFSAETLRQLSDIGRDITANLDAEAVYQALDRHAHALLDMTHLLVLMLDGEQAKLNCIFAVERGISISSENAVMDDAARCISERREILTDVDAGAPGSNSETRPIISRVFVPLTIGDRVIGVVMIQAARRNAYFSREQLIFRTLCAYTAIALDNSAAYRQVEATLTRLRETQAQLVQQEKMASLGTLTAGVAHEINNPANFAHVGAQGLGENLERFRTYLLKLAADDADQVVVDRLNQHIDALADQTRTIVEGTTRIKNLVLDLLMFARVERPGKAAVAVSECLISTINLVRAQYAETTEIRLELDADPEIECWPALLNQVFMNVTVNACQATQKKHMSTAMQAPGILTIRSRLEDNKLLVIEFEDHGCGIPADIIDHIFEPFFTTKIVGEGMGLGLSISFGIIEKHGGQMRARSTFGEGTCITVMLPLHGTSA